MMGLNGEFGYHELERAALGFVTESETWPVFLAWCRARAATGAGRQWAADPGPLEEVRDLWLAHSPNPLIRMLGKEA